MDQYYNLSASDVAANILASRKVCEENGQFVYVVTFIEDINVYHLKVSFSCNQMRYQTMRYQDMRWPSLTMRIGLPLSLRQVEQVAGATAAAAAPTSAERINLYRSSVLTDPDAEPSTLVIVAQ